ncbi:MAG: DUF1178 family protein [Pseudomonadota bacterium]
MIRYALACSSCGAGFDAWFRDQASCDQQIEARLVSCPSCGGTEISKALMAPSVAPSKRAAEGAAKGAPIEATPPHGASSAPPAPTPAMAPRPAAAAPPAAAQRREIEHKLRALRAFVEATAEPVGPRFAEEARAIHDGEAEARPIYGEASRDETEALLEDGVPVAPIPWIDKTDD